METVCKRYTEIPHTSRLFADLLYHFDRVARFYPHAPFRMESYREAAREIDYPESRRADLVAALRAQNGDSGNLRRLAQPNTYAVVTGQQVGLFSGPAYTIYKALTAAQLARRLSESEGVPAVPVFWLATEDHDFPEVSSCWSLSPSRQLVHLQLSATPAEERPVGSIPLGPLPFEKLQQSLDGYPFGEEVLELLKQTYHPDRTLGEAFRDLLARLTADYGILFFDPLHAKARELAAPFLAAAVEAAPELTEALLERNRELNDQHYHAQVHIERHTSLFFLLEDGKRVHLRRKNGDYLAPDRRLTPAELKDKAAQLSPNATLRPVLQDYMFPTVAYIGGPAELAYLAQSRVIYQRLLGRMPVAAPRNGFTLLDARTVKLMRRYQLDLSSFFEGEDALREHIAGRLIPPDIESAIASVSEETQRSLSRLRASLETFDPTLAASLDRSTAKIQYQITKVHRKVARESLKRSQRAQDEAAYLFNTLYPHKHLQERFFTILPFLAQHSTSLIGTIYDNVHVDCPDHHILHV